jgi:3-deoxy-D-manno-octulosonate 8-phosphate phosphatase (KDO 8-P phosphatase)
MAIESSGSALPPRLAEIQLLGVDVDGVLTDGRLWYGAEGELIKAFHVHDGLGLKRLQAAGVEVVVISARHSVMVDRRLDDLGIRTRIQACADKGAALAELMELRGLQRAQVAFVGDDLPDLLAYAVAGLRIAVANAQPAVRAAADWVTTRHGGAGAVREICELLIAARAGQPA